MEFATRFGGRESRLIITRSLVSSPTTPCVPGDRSRVGTLIVEPQESLGDSVCKSRAPSQAEPMLGQRVLRGAASRELQLGGSDLCGTFSGRRGGPARIPSFRTFFGQRKPEIDANSESQGPQVCTYRRCSTISLTILTFRTPAMGQAFLARHYIVGILCCIVSITIKLPSSCTKSGVFPRFFLFRLVFRKPPSPARRTRRCSKQMR